jgi:2,4-dienoyl-CoA reductase-like NADH-dependent reductase (Old Yellow Enzyme family)
MSFWQSPLLFPQSKRLCPHRIVLAPLTNTQSDEKGVLSELEIDWLYSRAQAGFALVISAASYVQDQGRVWPKALGACTLDHQAGIKKLSQKIHLTPSLLLMQLFHGGIRALPKWSGLNPASPGQHPPSSGYPQGLKALEPHEIEKIQQDFVHAALLCEQAGADGIEIHAAHGYLLSTFMDSYWNNRKDAWGNDIQGRSKLILDIITEIRKRARKDFIIGLRLSLDNHGLLKGTYWQDSAWLAGEASSQLDYVHASLWDIRKTDPQGQSLLRSFKQALPADLPLMVAGSIRSQEDLNWIEQENIALAAIGKAAIAHLNWPKEVFKEGFKLNAPPYTRSYLQSQNISEPFLNYLKSLPGMVES